MASAVGIRLGGAWFDSLTKHFYLFFAPKIFEREKIVGDSWASRAILSSGPITIRLIREVH